MYAILVLACFRPYAIPRCYTWLTLSRVRLGYRSTSLKLGRLWPDERAVEILLTDGNESASWVEISALPRWMQKSIIKIMAIGKKKVKNDEHGWAASSRHQ